MRKFLCKIFNHKYINWIAISNNPRIWFVCCLRCHFYEIHNDAYPDKIRKGFLR